MTIFDNSSLPATLDKMKMLFWRLDLSRRSFVNLNNCAIGVLGLENYRFFKDRKYREKMLFPDDRLLVDRAMENVKERIPVRIVFRVQSENSLNWFKLTGWPSHDYRYYDGAVEEITEHINWLKNTFDHQDTRLLQVDDADYPAALFDEKHRRLQKANRYFLELIGLDMPSMRNSVLEKLIKLDIKLPQLLENLLFDRKLTLELGLLTAQQDTLKVLAQFEYISYAGAGYLRFAVIDQYSQVADGRSQQKPVNQRLKGLCQQLADCWSIDAMLDCIHNEKKLFPGMDTVMFSDIYARRNKVFVYAKGRMNDPLPAGAQFPYSGTIAENIEKEKLEYLIVDDTQSSIKAIDWMLFVPQGLYSYVAKALYVRGAMRTVLILCSCKKRKFSDDQIEDVTTLANAFQSQLKKIRRAEK